MKKSQRLRLSQLIAREGSLNANEQLEANWLKALAAGNPDASKDEDDTPSGFRVSLMDAVSGRKALGAELATAKARITELEGQLVAAAKAPAAAAPAATATLPEGALSAAEVATLRAELATANQKLSAAMSQLSIFGSALGLKAGDVAAKSDADVRAAIDSRLGALAGEKIAELGFPAAKLPASSETSAGADTLVELREQLAAEKDPAKAGILAAKVIALRDKPVAGNN